jgi:hypothetical protein
MSTQRYLQQSGGLGISSDYTVRTNFLAYASALIHISGISCPHKGQFTQAKTECVQDVLNQYQAVGL